MGCINDGWFRLCCLGVNREEIGLGDAVASGDCETDAVDSFAELHDFIDWGEMAQEFGVGFGCDQADLSCPSDKGFPVQEHLIGMVGEMFACCVAEVEREVAADLVDDGLG